MTDVELRLANARDLRLDMSTSPVCLVPTVNSAGKFADGGQTMSTLRALSWPTNVKPLSLWGVGVPADALSFVQAYLDAGTGDEAISTKMPLLIWLVFMDHTSALQMLDAISRSASGDGAMQRMFADKWCRDILLEKMPALSPAREADEGPNLHITLDFAPGNRDRDGSRPIGIDASSFVCTCLHGAIQNREIDDQTFDHGYGSLEELLKRWKPAAKLSFVAGQQKGGWDQLVRDTLFQITTQWGKRIQDGGTINRKFTERLFKAMGGLTT